MSELPELLPRADVVVLIVPKTSETVGMVEAGFLSRMRRRCAAGERGPRAGGRHGGAAGRTAVRPAAGRARRHRSGAVAGRPSSVERAEPADHPAHRRARCSACGLGSSSCWLINCAGSRPASRCRTWSPASTELRPARQRDPATAGSGRHRPGSAAAAGCCARMAAGVALPARSTAYTAPEPVQPQAAQLVPAHQLRTEHRLRVQAVLVDDGGGPRDVERAGQPAPGRPAPGSASAPRR